MAYSLRKPLKKTTKRIITAIFTIISVIFVIISVIISVVEVKNTIWLHEDIRFNNDPNYIPQWMETKLWNLIDFPDSELLPIEKIQALFPLPEDESERTAIADELIHLFMEWVNPGYEIEKYFDTNNRFWINAYQRMEYCGAKGMFTHFCNYDPYNPDEGSIVFTWRTNGVNISYTYHTDGSAYKLHMTTTSGLSENYSYTESNLRYATYGILTGEFDNTAKLGLDKNTGTIKLRKGSIYEIAECSTEDLADYRRAQTNGEAPKRTTIKNISNFIEKKGG